MYAKTGLSPSAAFAGLALPVIATGSAVTTSLGAAVVLLGFRALGGALDALAESAMRERAVTFDSFLSSGDFIVIAPES